MSAMGLRREYAREASSHAGMMRREKTKGAIINPAFRKFGSFLALVGPKPDPRMTLDRIENEDREYGPGKVRWATARTQNRNKSDNILIKHPHRSGHFVSVAQLAELHGVSADTIRHRRRRGWTDRELFEGRRPRMYEVSTVEAPAKPEPKAHELTARKLPDTWRNAVDMEYSGEIEPEVVFVRQVKVFERIAREKPDALAVLKHTIPNWSRFAARAASAGAYKPPSVPSVDFYLKYEHVARDLRADDRRAPELVASKPKPKPEMQTSTRMKDTDIATLADIM